MSPSSGQVNGDMFENYKIFKVKSKIEKYEVEDLYLRREREVPSDIVEDIEKQMEKVEKKNASKRYEVKRKGGSNNPLSVIKAIMNESESPEDGQPLITEGNYSIKLSRDIYDLASNINKFSYKNLRDEKMIQKYKQEEYKNN